MLHTGIKYLITYYYGWYLVFKLHAILVCWRRMNALRSWIATHSNHKLHSSAPQRSLLMNRTGCKSTRRVITAWDLSVWGGSYEASSILMRRHIPRYIVKHLPDYTTSQARRKKCYGYSNEGFRSQLNRSGLWLFRVPVRTMPVLSESIWWSSSVSPGSDSVSHSAMAASFHMQLSEFISQRHPVIQPYIIRADKAIK
jgi:hypothetical protein